MNCNNSIRFPAPNTFRMASPCCSSARSVQRRTLCSSTRGPVMVSCSEMTLCRRAAHSIITTHIVWPPLPLPAPQDPPSCIERWCRPPRQWIYLSRSFDLQRIRGCTSAPWRIYRLVPVYQRLRPLWTCWVSYRDICICVVGRPVNKSPQLQLKMWLVADGCTGIIRT